MKSGKGETIEQLALNYDLSRSFSLLDSKVDYFTEANVLLNEKIKKQKKHVDNTKNLLVANNSYLNKSAPLSSSSIDDSSNLVNSDSNSSATLPPTSTTSLSYSLPNNKTPINLNKLESSSIHHSSNQAIANANFTSNIIHPISLSSNNTKLLEPVRKSNATLNNTTSTSTTANANTNNDSNNNSTKTNDVNNKNNFKDLFNFDSSSLDPFNDMELKTINDLEELKAILQNQQNEKDKELELAQQQTPTHLNLNGINSNPQQQLYDVSLSNANINNIKLIQSNNFLVDNFGLPKISFVDLDINSKKF